MTAHRVCETYIGDGVYASFDGYQIWLRDTDTEHRIALEPSAMNKLHRFATEVFRPAPDPKGAP